MKDVLSTREIAIDNDENEETPPEPRFFEVVFADDVPSQWSPVYILAKTEEEAEAIAKQMLEDNDAKLAYRDEDTDEPMSLNDVYDRGSEVCWEAASETYACVNDNWHNNPEWEFGQRLLNWMRQNTREIGNSISGSDFVEEVYSIAGQCGCEFSDEEVAEVSK